MFCVVCVVNKGLYYQNGRIKIHAELVVCPCTYPAWAFSHIFWSHFFYVAVSADPVRPSVCASCPACVRAYVFFLSKCLVTKKTTHTYFDECQTENEAVSIETSLLFLVGLHVSTENRNTETHKKEDLAFGKLWYWNVLPRRVRPLESYGAGMYFLEGFGHIGLPAHLTVGLWQRFS